MPFPKIISYNIFAVAKEKEIHPCAVVSPQEKFCGAS